MNIKSIVAALVLLLGASAVADDDRVKTAVAAGAGAAVGSVIGDELGDRKGAIIGSAVGAAVGAAVVTDGDDDHHHRSRDGVVVVAPVVSNGHPHVRHCPPGQAKKGRC